MITIEFGFVISCKIRVAKPQLYLLSLFILKKGARYYLKKEEEAKSNM